jgi:predicted metal-dependent HD superfamily phosphohydrolase
MANPNSDRWFALWKRLQAKSDPAPIYLDLIGRYSEPHRAYHNLGHVEACFLEFDPVRHLANNEDALEAAIWFHDVVYDTHAKDNEERSTAMAESTLTAAGFPDKFTKNVLGLIFATKHTCSPDNPDAALLVDVDLSILGQPQVKFDEYERQIREEYDWVDSQAFAAGRSSILKLFLERPFIYSTDAFRGKYEVRARENMIRSIAHLG